MSVFRKKLNHTNKRNALIIGIGLAIVILFAMYSAYRLTKLLDSSTTTEPETQHTESVIDTSL